MTAVRIVVFIAGVGVIGFGLLSAVRTVVLPRAAPDPISRAVFRTNYLVFRFLTQRRETYEARDRIMALFAPVSLLMMPGAWVTVVAAGYTGLFWVVGVDGWSTAFKTSGSSLLTLGFAPVSGGGQTILAFSEAVIGLALIALLITYLPSMYNAFRQREAGVGLLEVRAGSPPWGVELLERFHRIDWLDHLPELFEEWEAWFIDIEESHTSLPALVFFRSPHPDRSWITAAGAVLDGASLAVSSLERDPMPQTQLSIRAGYLALRRIADFFGIEYDPEPEPDDPISITRGEYDSACDRMARAGLAVKPDRDQAWRDFAGWRVNYDTVLLALCGLTMAPYAPWSSDRSRSRWGRQPTPRRWGRALKRARRRA